MALPLLGTCHQPQQRDCNARHGPQLREVVVASSCNRTHSVTSAAHRALHAMLGLNTLSRAMKCEPWQINQARNVIWGRRNTVRAQRRRGRLVVRRSREPGLEQRRRLPHIAHRTLRTLRLIGVRQWLCSARPRASVFSTGKGSSPFPGSYLVLRQTSRIHHMPEGSPKEGTCATPYVPCA